MKRGSLLGEGKAFFIGVAGRRRGRGTDRVNTEKIIENVYGRAIGPSENVLEAPFTNFRFI